MDLENPQILTVLINLTYKVCLILSTNPGNALSIPKGFSKSRVFKNVNNVLSFISKKEKERKKRKKERKKECE